MTAPRCSFEDAAQALRAGGVLLLATDTVPGLHCRADDSAAVRRITAGKMRAPGKALLILAGSAAQVREVAGALNEAQTAACDRCWPGPFSLILPAGPVVASEVTGGGATLAVRVPAVEALRDLILAVGVPLVSTSANRSGEPPARHMAAAARDCGSLIDGIWGVDDSTAAKPGPSALVDLTVTPFRVLRPGPKPFPQARI